MFNFLLRIVKNIFMFIRLMFYFLTYKNELHHLGLTEKQREATKQFCLLKDVKIFLKKKREGKRRYGCERYKNLPES